MKTVFALLPLLLFGHVASAEAASECRSIAQPKARLACYDKSDDGAKVPARADQPAFKDPNSVFSAEDARTNAKLKGICRGC